MLQCCERFADGAVVPGPCKGQAQHTQTTQLLTSAAPSSLHDNTLTCGHTSGVPAYAHIAILPGTQYPLTAGASVLKPDTVISKWGNAEFGPTSPAVAPRQHRTRVDSLVNYQLQRHMIRSL